MEEKTHGTGRRNVNGPIFSGANPGCIITKRAMETETIGYMYQDEPAKDFRLRLAFFVGDEPDEYVNQAENNTIISLTRSAIWIRPSWPISMRMPGANSARTEDGWEEEF